MFLTCFDLVVYTLHANFLPSRPITDRHQQSRAQQKTGSSFEALKIALAKDITQHAVCDFCGLFKLDFSLLRFMVWILFPKEEDTTREWSNGSFIGTRKRRKKLEESESTSRWQWIQDRKLLYRQFNFTQRNHKLFILFDFHFVFFYYVLLPFNDDHNIFGLLIAATGSKRKTCNWWMQALRSKKQNVSRIQRGHLNMRKPINHVAFICVHLRAEEENIFSWNYPTVIFYCSSGTAKQT